MEKQAERQNETNEERKCVVCARVRMMEQTNGIESLGESGNQFGEFNARARKNEHDKSCMKNY